MGYKGRIKDFMVQELGSPCMSYSYSIPLRGKINENVVCL